MKTTVEISDPLLREVRELAAREGVTLRTGGTWASSCGRRNQGQGAVQAASGQLQREGASGGVARCVVGDPPRPNLQGSRGVIAFDSNILVYAHVRIRRFTKPPFRCVAALTEGSGYWPTLRAMVADGRVTGAQVHDTRVAALCRQHGVRELWSADRDFSRFTGFAVVNPLIGGE
jgi:hypothetical protein